MKKYFIAVLFANFVVADLVSQTAMVRTYGGDFFEEGQQIIQTLDGGYAIVGTTGSDQEENTDFYLLKLDQDLNCIWSYYYGGPDVEWGYSIAEDDLGNLVLCGYTNSMGAGGYDVLVIKTDAEGQELWRKTYGGDDWDFGYKIIRHPESGYLIAGETWSNGNGASDGYLLHIDGSGDLVGEWTFGGEGEDGFRDVEISNSNNVIAIGHSLNFGLNLDRALWIVSLSETYELNWEFLTPLFTESYGLELEISDTDIYYGGNYYSDSENFDNPLFGKLTLAGESLWEIDGSGDSNESLLYTDDYLITSGVSDNFGAGEADIVVHRRSHEGGWFNGITVGGELTEMVSQLFEDSQGQLIILGSSNSYSESHDVNIYLVRYETVEIGGGYDYQFVDGECFAIGVNEFVAKDDIEHISFNQFVVSRKNEIENIDFYCPDGRLYLSFPNGNFDSELATCLSTGCYLCRVKLFDGTSRIFKIYLF